jgi:choline dehydrogenase-like flavoprotein
MFMLVSRRYGRASLIVTSNKPFSAWGEIFGDENPPSLFLGSFHHMGTTRMHESPKQGVVDHNCQVHGVQNLFVAGSSVFPTSGFANPTLTIVALSLRLADHIKGRLAV